MRGFTVVDVLVSVAVITLLISLLMPSLSLVRETARRVVCASNVRQVGLGLAMYADDHRDYLPPVDLTGGFQGGDPQYQVSMRIRKTGAGEWDGLGLLWAGDYLSSCQVFFCPSHTGDHPYSHYGSQWSGAEGVVFGNLQYRYNPQDSRFIPVRLFSSPNIALLSDGLRTRDDFNHRVGSNVMRTDLAVVWFADPTGRVLASLPLTDNDADSAGRVAEAWVKLDTVDAPDR